MQTWLPEYDALTTAAGVVDLSDRTLIELTGKDRASFLHNLCTNDIKRLQPGQGCELFLTNVQGKTIGHGFAFCHADALVLETVPGQAETILATLERYHVREEVQLTDRTDAWAEVLLAGPEADALLAKLGVERLPSERLEHVAAQLGELPVVVRRVDLTRPHGYLLQVATEDMSRLRELLAGAGGVRCGAEAFEAARIEAGTPLFGRDITSANLPQEVDRDHLAISFTKGCYLGQETVARLDALGHVNKTFCGLRLASDEIPAAGTELLINEKPVATITSATFSPRLQAPLALAYLRRNQTPPSAEVVKLPLE